MTEEKKETRTQRLQRIMTGPWLIAFAGLWLAAMGVVGIRGLIKDQDDPYVRQSVLKARETNKSCADMADAEHKRLVEHDRINAEANAVLDKRLWTLEARLHATQNMVSLHEAMLQDRALVPVKPKPKEKQD